MGLSPALVPVGASLVCPVVVVGWVGEDVVNDFESGSSSVDVLVLLPNDNDVTVVRLV